LASGFNLDQVGSPVDPRTLKDLAIPAYQVTEIGIVGAIQYIDHFGNLVTNIPASAVSGWNWTAKLGNESILMPAVKQYSDVPKGTAIALIGSHGWVELAINQGNACQAWDAKVGLRVELIA
jgi:S-adenosyl-L-methionine hydrolase (adenosine-forming)